MSSLDSAAAAVHANGRARLSVVLLAVSAFVIVTTEFLIVGLLPALARDLGLGIARAGQLVTLFAFTVMLAGPPLTALLSHVGRRRLFVAILLLFAGSNALAAMATQPWLLALARVLPALALPVFWGTASETAAQLALQGRAVVRSRGSTWVSPPQCCSVSRWVRWLPTPSIGAAASGCWRPCRC